MNVIFNLLRTGSGLLSAAALAWVVIMIIAQIITKSTKGLGTTMGSIVVITAAVPGHALPMKQRTFLDYMDITQVGLMVLFGLMIATVFLPVSRPMIHVVAAFAVVSVAWCGLSLVSDVRVEAFTLPAMVLWLVFYAMTIMGNRLR